MTAAKMKYGHFRKLWELKEFVFSCLLFYLGRGQRETKEVDSKVI